MSTLDFPEKWVCPKSEENLQALGPGASSLLFPPGLSSASWGDEESHVLPPGLPLRPSDRVICSL